MCNGAPSWGMLLLAILAALVTAGLLAASFYAGFLLTSS